ncbi:MAG: response regulator transcription factor [Chloroflexi bacterium]|nr:response regulator transcription factor [Chloroflexota bacterium]
MTQPIRVLIVDDHPVYAEGLRAILGVESDLELVGLAADGVEAIRLAEETQPDVAIIDARMPGMPGPEVATQLRTRLPTIRLLVLSGFDDDDLVFGMIKAGVAGYVLKDAAAAEIAQAIRHIHAGGSQLTPSVAWKLLQQFNALSRESGPAGDSLYDGLTPRELEVLRLVAGGRSNKEVAAELFISERTVENHIHNMYQKLQIHDRTQAMMYAMRKGLIQLQE